MLSAFISCIGDVCIRWAGTHACPCQCLRHLEPIGCILIQTCIRNLKSQDCYMPWQNTVYSGSPIVVRLLFGVRQGQG